MENIKALFDLSKLPTKFFLLFSLVTSFLLFADETVLKNIHLDKINNDYGQWIGLIFLLSTGLFIINIIIWIFKYLNLSLRNIRLKRKFEKSLKKLDLKEQAVLREFLLNQQTALNVPIDDAVISGLLQKEILTINNQFNGSFIIDGTRASLSINSIAEKTLNMEDVGFSEKPTEEEIRKAYERRPAWAKNSYN
ncbi:super-infection exclusion protein B [Dokdonia sp. R86516]|uniref:super-infection exclusion protein B n=1 Tax=Dokdonia sp. R86516 TaxID=3093856 RepID=UPI0037C70B72